MEEYRDLDLTVTAFRQVLDEPEFLALRAGIVLQAYLPDSHRVQRALTEWAIARRRRGGAPIKLRIVKGANLAMERIEAAAHGWPQAPYPTKVEVDANYKRMLEYGCRPEHAEAVHLGVASHNLFDIAYGLVLREAHGVAPWVEFEMLEGMANHQARAVQARAGGLLLYAPVVRAEDFHSAIAYLVRRLDENTAPENFLRHVFDLEPGSPDWNAERDRFLAAFGIEPGLPDTPRRTQDRAAEACARAPLGPLAAPFANDPDTDWTLAPNRAWIEAVAAAWREHTPDAIPLQVGGELRPGGREAEGRDPSRPGRVAYRHALGGPADVERALQVAQAAQATWAARPPAEREARLEACAAELHRRRGDLIGAMIVDGAKTVPEADAEVSEAVDFARYYARTLREAAGELGGCRMEPLGVVVVTPPWNFPLSIPAGGVLAALAAGNAVILKPAPEAVLTGWGLASGLWEAGIPQEVLQFLPVPDDETGKQPGDGSARGRRHPHRLRRDGAALPRLAARSPALRRDEREERDHRHRARGPGPGHPRSRPVGVRPQRPEVLGGEPRHLRGRGVRRPGLPAAAARRGVEPGRGQRLGPGEPRHAAHPGAGPRAPARAHRPRRGRGVAPRAAPGAGQPAALVARHQARRAARRRSSIARSASAPCWGSCAPRTSTRRSRSPTPRRSGSRAASRRWTIARSCAGSTGSRPATST